MSIRTILARITNWVRKEAAHIQLNRLAKAAEHDFDVVVQTAEKAYAATQAEVGKIAHAEAVAIENAFAAIKRRAANLSSTGKTPPAKVAAVDAIATAS